MVREFELRECLTVNPEYRDIRWWPLTPVTVVSHDDEFSSHTLTTVPVIEIGADSECLKLSTNGYGPVHSRKLQHWHEYCHFNYTGRVRATWFRMRSALFASPTISLCQNLVPLSLSNVNRNRTNSWFPSPCPIRQSRRISCIFDVNRLE
jgi:hypothetical protein